MDVVASAGNFISSTTSNTQIGRPEDFGGPSLTDIGIVGGNFSNTHIGPRTSNNKFIRKEKSVQQDLSHSSIETVNITHVTVLSPAASSPSTYSQSTPEDDHKEWTELSKQLRYYHNRRICGHKFIFYGEEYSEVTGVTPVAVKLLPFSDAHIREAMLLRELKHPHIVTILQTDSCMLGPIKQMYIALELCHEKNLHDFIMANSADNVPFDNDLSLTQAKQLVDALEYIHSKRIIHRDLKPHNILLSFCQKFLKIADFGMSKEAPDENHPSLQSMTRVGTDGYRAPETYNKNMISQQSDVFSLGLIFHFMWTLGLHPFGEDPDEWNINIKKHRNLDLTGLLVDDVPNAEALLRKMLQLKPCSRPTAEQLSSFAIFSKTGCARHSVDSTTACEATSKHMPMPEQSEIAFNIDGEQCNRRVTADTKRRAQTEFSSRKTASVQLRNRCQTSPVRMAAKVTENHQKSMEAPKTTKSKQFFYERGSEVRFTPTSSSVRMQPKPPLTPDHSQMPRPYSVADLNVPLLPEILHSHGDIQDYKKLVVFDKTNLRTHIYIPTSKSWKGNHMIHPPMGKLNFSAVTLDGYIYLLFSNRSVTRLKSSNYNSMWEPLPPMQYSHGQYPPAVVLRGKIYVLGSVGGVDVGANRSVECFSPRKNCWSNNLPMRTPRYHHTVVTAQGSIYCVGGQSARALLSSVDTFDPIRNVWQDSPRMVHSRAFPSATSYQQRLYVLGGYCAIPFEKGTKISTVEVYNISEKIWTVLTQMLKPRAEFSTLIINKEMFVVGGDKKGFQDEKKTIEHYSFATQKWNLFQVCSRMKIDSMSAVAM